MRPRTRLLAGGLLVIAPVLLYGLLHGTVALETVVDSSVLHARLVLLGPWGPVAIVARMIDSTLMAAGTSPVMRRASDSVVAVPAQSSSGRSSMYPTPRTV